MHNRNSSFPIFFSALFSLFLSLHPLGASDSLPVKSTASTNAAPAPAVPPPPAESLPAPVTTERPTAYTVVSGDTLWDLSHKFNCSVKALKMLNKLKKNALKRGQVLQIPPPKNEKPAPPATKPTASTKPVLPTAQVKTASRPSTYPHAQPVQDFDIPASTFASCPTPPSVSEPDVTSTASSLPEPAVTETPALRALPVAASELNPPTPKIKTMAAVLPPASKLTSHGPDPLITTPANEWGTRFLQAARDLGNRDIEYNESWRPPGETQSWDMDCSNTARYIYKITTGIQLPRTASDQYYYLHLQNKAWDAPQTSTGFADCNFLRENLKPGDLLFWENTYRPERQPPITHVMVYLGKNSQGHWIMAGSQTGKGGEHNRNHGGPDVYVFDPTRPCGGYTTWLGMVHHQGRFCAYGRPLEADKAKLAVAAND